MGSDDFHHRRKARITRDLERRKSRRAPYDRVLIVCEGSKTEPNYLQELIDYLKLNSANVEVDGNCGSSPISVVQHAKSRYAEEKRKNDAYDRVFCVIDKDTHPSYAQAMDEISRSLPRNVFSSINSVPCFEYWLLLHFIYSTRSYRGAGGRSACSRLIDDLRGYIAGYSKGDRGLFKTLIGQTDQAVAYSMRALDAAARTGTDNPTTLMHELVEYLRHLED